MAQFSIEMAIFSLGGVDYCTSDVNVTYTTESLSFLCLENKTPLKFPGAEEWAGSATLAYDDDGMEVLRGFEGDMSFVIETSTGESLTLSGEIVITSSDSSFNKTAVPTFEISFDGSSDLNEDVS